MMSSGAILATSFFSKAKDNLPAAKNNPESTLPSKDGAFRQLKEDKADSSASTSASSKHLYSSSSPKEEMPSLPVAQRQNIVTVASSSSKSSSSTSSASSTSESSEDDEDDQEYLTGSQKVDSAPASVIKSLPTLNARHSTGGLSNAGSNTFLVPKKPRGSAPSRMRPEIVIPVISGRSSPMRQRSILSPAASVSGYPTTLLPIDSPPPKKRASSLILESAPVKKRPSPPPKRKKKVKDAIDALTSRRGGRRGGSTSLQAGTVFETLQEFADAAREYISQGGHQAKLDHNIIARVYCANGHSLDTDEGEVEEDGIGCVCAFTAKEVRRGKDYVWVVDDAKPSHCNECDELVMKHIQKGKIPIHDQSGWRERMEIMAETARKNRKHRSPCSPTPEDPILKIVEKEQKRKVKRSIAAADHYDPWEAHDEEVRSERAKGKGKARDDSQDAIVQNGTVNGKVGRTSTDLLSKAGSLAVRAGSMAVNGVTTNGKESKKRKPPPFSPPTQQNWLNSGKKRHRSEASKKKDEKRRLASCVDYLPDADPTPPPATARTTIKSFRLAPHINAVFDAAGIETVQDLVDRGLDGHEMLDFLVALREFAKKGERTQEDYLEFIDVFVAARRLAPAALHLSSGRIEREYSDEDEEDDDTIG